MFYKKLFTFLFSIALLYPLAAFASHANADSEAVIMQKKILGKNKVNGVNSLTQEMMNTPNTIYVIKYDFVLGENITIPDNCVLCFKRGSIANGTITPNGTKVVAKKKRNIFRNITFNTSSSHYFKDSKLVATNFGFISDMYSQDESYEFEGKTYKAKVRKGTPNNEQIKILASFCSFSDNVSICFNGKFLGESNCNIRNANNLELYGGMVQSGLFLTDCKYCEIHDVKIVGFHEIHDFPPFEPDDNTWYKFGLITQQGVMCKTSANTGENDESMCHHINVYNCHVEMRMAGIHFGSIDKAKRYVYRPSNCSVYNCSGDHLIWQIVGMHAIDCTADNIKCNYAFQAFDLSTGSIRCSINNSSSTNVYVGGKMQGEDNYTSYGNSFYNIKEIVNDVFPCEYPNTYGAFINHCEDCSIEKYEITINRGNKYAPLYINNVSGANVHDIKIRTVDSGNVTTIINYYMPSGDIHIKDVDADCLLSGNHIIHIGKTSNNASLYLYDSRINARPVKEMVDKYFAIPATLLDHCQINTNDAYLYMVRNIKDSSIETQYIKQYQSLNNCEVKELNPLKKVSR